MTIGIVKSGGRSLEVMEFFSDCRDASVMQVARALGYPQSSTSELLQSLAALGYLRYDTRRRTFSAGVRAALLGATLSARVFGAGDIARLLEQAALETDRGAHVCDVVGDKVHYLLNSAWRAGARAPMPLAASAAGLLFLSSLADADAVQIAAQQGGCEISGEALSDRLARVRRDGHAVHSDCANTELAVPLNRRAGAALTLCGPRFSDEAQSGAMARRVQALVRRWRNPEVRRRLSAC